MKIFLAMDTSSASQVALEQVAERPWPVASSWEVLSVVEPSHLWTTSEVALGAVRHAEQVVQRAVARLRSDTPKAIILAEAAQWEADLIVLGSHGRRGMDRLLLGSVSEAAALHAKCSVEVIR